MRKTILLLATIFFFYQARTQSITGANCVKTDGTQYQYTISGSWTSSTTMNWTLVGGVIAGTQNTTASGTPMPTIYVTWNSGVSSGSVSLTTSNPTGSASLTIS